MVACQAHDTANVALRHDAEVLASDGDFGRIAMIVPLRLHDATPRPR